jgi:hypothetical protein
LLLLMLMLMLLLLLLLLLLLFPPLLLHLARLQCAAASRLPRLLLSQQGVYFLRKTRQFQLRTRQTIPPLKPYLRIRPQLLHVFSTQHVTPPTPIISGSRAQGCRGGSCKAACRELQLTHITITTTEAPMRVRP